MTHNKIHAIIDSYSLADCKAVLELCAPDLLEPIAVDMRLYPERPETLAKARNAVRAALDREHKQKKPEH